MERKTVFVYGTLRKGFGNNRLLEESRFLGKAVSQKKYCMYAAGIPYVYEFESLSTIVGEVYEVDSHTLQRLDQLEGHPKFYTRRPITVYLETGKAIEADIYFNDNIRKRPHLRKVLNGDYGDYADQQTKSIFYRYSNST